MRLVRIFTVTALTLSLFVSSATTAENVWPKGAPTPKQIKEFFSQIESGRVTKENLRVFLDSSKTASYKDYEPARLILGNDLITPEEITNARRVSYTKDQLSHFTRTLPSEDILHWAKINGYAVVAGPPIPLNLLEIRLLKPELFWSQRLGWYANESFAKNDKAATNWLIIRKDAVPDSTGKNWNDQLRLLSKDEQVPNVGEIAWFITTFYEVRNIRLFDQIFVRTSSVRWFDDHVYVGNVGEFGIDIDAYVDSRSLSSWLGLAAARKYPALKFPVISPELE